MILIDSCMIIPLVRRGIDPAREFSLLAEQDDLCTCGVVRCETSRAIRNPKIRRAYQAYLDCLLYSPDRGIEYSLLPAILACGKARGGEHSHRAL